MPEAKTSKEKCIEDFIYFCDALRNHPILLQDEKKRKFSGLLENLQKSILDYDSLVVAMTKMTMFFEDGHTNIEIPYTYDDYCIGMDCRWHEERLLLKEKYGSVEAGTEIVAVEGLSPEQILRYAATVIPHENIYLVKSRMVEYPYQNYHMFSEKNLVQMFGKKQSYSITFKKGHEKFTQRCKLVMYDGFLDFQESNFVHYTIEDDKAILHLDGCIYDDVYKHVLGELARLCKERGIATLELDLSKNMGGTSRVIDEFIRYIDVDSFRRYEMIDFSAGAPDIVCSRKQIVKNNKQELLFPKRILCRVSNTTFSSARTFAVTLKDNHIAKIVGQPTGGKPCSYGMPKKDKTPNYDIRFRVSRCLFLRPDENLENEISLMPEADC